MIEAKMESAQTIKKLLDGQSQTSQSKLKRSSSRRVSAVQNLTTVSIRLSYGTAIKELVTDANFEANDEGLVRTICIYTLLQQP